MIQESIHVPLTDSAVFHADKEHHIRVCQNLSLRQQLSRELIRVISHITLPVQKQVLFDQGAEIVVQHDVVGVRQEERLDEAPREVVESISTNGVFRLIISHRSIV